MLFFFQTPENQPIYQCVWFNYSLETVDEQIHYGQVTVELLNGMGSEDIQKSANTYESHIIIMIRFRQYKLHNSVIWL